MLSATAGLLISMLYVVYYRRFSEINCCSPTIPLIVMERSFHLKEFANDFSSLNNIYDLEINNVFFCLVAAYLMKIHN